MAFFWIPAISEPLIGWEVDMHLQANCWSDWVQMWLASSLHASPIMFGDAPLNPCCFLVPDWLRNLKEFTGGIELKFCWPNFYGPYPAWSTFGHAKFPLFHRLWLVKQFWYICRHIADRIDLEFCGPTHYGPLPAWLAFGHAPLYPNDALFEKLIVISQIVFQVHCS